VKIHPTITKALLGSLPGVAIAGAGTAQLLSSHRKSMDLVKGDLVDAKKMVLKHEPGTIVATTASDLKKIQSTDAETKQLAKILDYVRGGTNAAFISGKGSILSPKMINRSLIGHEIGHVRDYRKHGYTPLDYAGIRAAMEERAWKESPFQDPVAKDVANSMVGTYRGANKIAIGAPIAVAGAMTLPLLWKVLKK